MSACSRRPGSPGLGEARLLATIDALEQLRKEPELEWSFLAPSAELKTGERTGKFRLGETSFWLTQTMRAKFRFKIMPWP